MLVDRTLFKTKEDLNHSCVTSASFGNLTNVVRLLKIGADPNYLHERDGWGALHYATRWNDIKMLQALVYFGADVNLKTRVGKESALHIAAMFSRKDAAIFLLQKGADRNPRNQEENKTAAELAVDPELKYILANWDECKDTATISSSTSRVKR